MLTTDNKHEPFFFFVVKSNKQYDLRKQSFFSQVKTFDSCCFFFLASFTMGFHMKFIFGRRQWSGYTSQKPTYTFTLYKIYTEIHRRPPHLNTITLIQYHSNTVNCFHFSNILVYFRISQRFASRRCYSTCSLHGLQQVRQNSCEQTYI